MAINKPKHILIAPLDWGLGHTTRCIPIIRHILRLGHIPLFAGNENQRSYIADIFPDIETIDLPGYNVTYSRANVFLQAGLVSQLPRLHRTINAEHRWLAQLATQRQIDGVISDNRYGLHHAGIPCVIMTHQLRIRSGLGKTIDNVIQRIHYKFLDRFDEVWVPDTEGDTNLAGDLAHPERMPQRMKFVGLLSSMKPCLPHIVSKNILVLLSGPEPQRTELSHKLWLQVTVYDGPVTFVEGSVDAARSPGIPAHITYHRRLAGESLNQAICEADMVICRSGYSTIMDLVRLGKKAILIPTPGQTEQQYLAQHLQDTGIMPFIAQHAFCLGDAISISHTFPYRDTGLAGNFQSYTTVLTDWLDSQ